MEAIEKKASKHPGSTANQRKNIPRVLAGRS
jgi:hypothetical protein